MGQQKDSHFVVLIDLARNWGRKDTGAAIESLIASRRLVAKTARGGFVTLTMPNYQPAMMPVIRNWLPKAVA